MTRASLFHFHLAYFEVFFWLLSLVLSFWLSSFHSPIFFPLRTKVLLHKNLSPPVPVCSPHTLADPSSAEKEAPSAPFLTRNKSCSWQGACQDRHHSEHSIPTWTTMNGDFSRPPHIVQVVLCPSCQIRAPRRQHNMFWIQPWGATDQYHLTLLTR